MSGRPYRFYAAEISYFSAKVRPALRYKGVPYLLGKRGFKLALDRAG